MKKMLKSIVIMGAGGHAKSCVDVIESTGKYRIVGLTGKPSDVGCMVLGYPVIGTDETLPKLRKKPDCLALGIGSIRSTELREQCYKKARELGFELPVIVSSSATVSVHCKIGAGTIVFHGSVVNASAEIGACNIINSGSLIEHDAKTGDFCHISTGVIINGSTILGDRCFIGSGSVLANNLVVSSNSFIKSGSIVSQNQ